MFYTTVFGITGHFKRLTGNNFDLMPCITTRIIFVADTISHRSQLRTNRTVRIGIGG